MLCRRLKRALIYITFLGYPAHLRLVVLTITSSGAVVRIVSTIHVRRAQRVSPSPVLRSLPKNAIWHWRGVALFYSHLMFMLVSAEQECYPPLEGARHSEPTPMAIA